MKRTKNHLFLLSALCAMTLFVSLVSCKNDDDHFVQSMLPETRSINLTDVQKEMVQQNNTFALDLFRAVYEQNGAKSMSFSPMGTTYMLGMVENGASDEARKEINDVMGFGKENTEDVNLLCKRLMEDAPKVDPSVTLEVANAVIASKDIKLNHSFVETLQKYYDAKVSSMDFSDPKTVDHINNWAKEKSHGKIDQVVDEINSFVRAYILNSIYFEGGWRYKFDKEQTTATDFTAENGDVLEVEMMHAKAAVHYAEDADCQMLCLPYGSGKRGEAWNMHLILPKPGMSVKEELEQLDSHKWAALRNAEKPFYLDLMIPKFQTKSQTALHTILPEMGIEKIFKITGSMGNMSDAQNLLIDKMEQHAGIEVDETGCKMATITISEISEIASNDPKYPEAPTEFRADRPFIYIISENSSGAIFFTGVYHGN